MLALPGVFLVFLLELQRLPFLFLSRLEHLSFRLDSGLVLPRSCAGHGKAQHKRNDHTDKEFSHPSSASDSLSQVSVGRKLPRPRLFLSSVPSPVESYRECNRRTTGKMTGIADFQLPIADCPAVAG
jgi:hypothetical protein